MRSGRRRLLLPIVLAAVLLAGALAAPSAGAVGRTGRYLVVFKRPSAARSAASGPRLIERLGLRRAGPGAPALGVLTVRGPGAALAALRHDPRVASVSPEYKRELRLAPNDPALTAPETSFGGLPGGGPIEWYLAREDFPAAWSVTTGGGAVLGVIDTGLDGGHPELSGKVASTAALGSSNPLHDEDGHGTHVSGLACAATDDRLATAGAGWGCRLAVVKAPQLRDEDVIDGIQFAVDHGAQAINMSFGGGPPSGAIESAIDYAVSHRVVLVAAASDFADTDQGSPANQLQPGDAPNINAGRGLVVTGADITDRNAQTGMGPQISLAAYGFAGQSSGPPGLISTYPGNTTPRETGPFRCGCRRNLFGDNRYAYLQGTSMAAPQVAALAAMLGALSPRLTATEKMRVVKETARRSGGWNQSLGWGLLDAGRAVDVGRRIDHYAPISRARAARRLRGARSVRVRVRWSRRDPAVHAGLIPSGVRWVDLYMKGGRGRYRRVRRHSRRTSALLHLRRGVYRFYTRATDRAGNRERPPRHSDVRVVVR